jgi:hypothetical protein
MLERFLVPQLQHVFLKQGGAPPHRSLDAVLS